MCEGTYHEPYNHRHEEPRVEQRKDLENPSDPGTKQEEEEEDKEDKGEEQAGQSEPEARRRHYPSRRRRRVELV